MDRSSAHIHPWETFEAVFGAALLLSVVMGFIFPLPLSIFVSRAVSISAGIVLFFVGICIILITRRQFRLANQPTDPGNPTTHLITTGVFSWSRNPLYLGGVMVFTGLAALLNSLWLLILLILAVIVAHVILIFPEEHYLAARFGETYLRYARSVRRWIGRRNPIHHP